MTGGARRPHRHRLDEPRHRLPRPRPGAQRIDGRTIDVDDDPPSGRMVRYAAIGRRRHGPLYCCLGGGALLDRGQVLRLDGSSTAAMLVGSGQTIISEISLRCTAVEAILVSTSTPLPRAESN